MSRTILHRWNVNVIVDGKRQMLGGVDLLPECDRSKQYDHPALGQLAAHYADAEFGAGKWRFEDVANPYQFNAEPASDYGLSR